MEEQQTGSGVLSHFGGIIRIAVFIIVLGILTFFIIRFVRHRQDTQSAQRASQTSKSEKQQSNSTTKSKSQSTDSTSNENVAKNDTNEDGTSSSDSSDGAIAVPNGVADGVSPEVSSSHSAVPNTGMDQNIIVTAILLSVISYLSVKNAVYTKELLK